MKCPVWKSLSLALPVLLAVLGCSGGEGAAEADSPTAPDGIEDAASAQDASDLSVAPDANGGEAGDAAGLDEPDGRAADAAVSPSEVAALPDLSSAPDTAQLEVEPLEVVEEQTQAELTPPALADPGDKGELGVTSATGELQIGDGWGATKIPLTIRLPLQPGSHPVVVFLHGFQLSPADYVSYGDHLASWGYVVVMPKMPSGTFGFGAPNHVELKQYLAAVLDWIEDDVAKGAGGALQGKADLAHIGLAGHSMGGKISLLLATEDKRPLAVVGLDPVDAAGGPLAVDPADYPSVTPELMGKISIPIVLLGETLNGTCSGAFCQACAPEDDNFHQYFLHATGPALEIEVLEASHMSFLDNPNCGLACSLCPAGTDDPSVTRRLSRRYMTAFFNTVLAGQPAFAEFLTGPQMDQDVADGLVATSPKNGF